MPIVTSRRSAKSTLTSSARSKPTREADALTDGDSEGDADAEELPDGLSDAEGDGESDVEADAESDGLTALPGLVNSASKVPSDFVVTV